MNALAAIRARASDLQHNLKQHGILVTSTDEMLSVLADLLAVIDQQEADGQALREEGDKLRRRVGQYPYWHDAIRAKEAAEAALAQLHAAQERLKEPDFWRCRACGCVWRDNHDGSVSLGSAKQASCSECEMKPTPDVCEPLYRGADDLAALATPAPTKEPNEP